MFAVFILKGLKYQTQIQLHSEAPNQANVRYFRSRRRALTKADYYGNDKHIGHVSTNGQFTNGWNGQRHALYRLPGPVNN